MYAQFVKLHIYCQSFVNIMLYPMLKPTIADRVCCFMYVCIYVVLLSTLVVKTTVYLTDLNDYAAVNGAYSEGKYVNFVLLYVCGLLQRHCMCSKVHVTLWCSSTV